jgi:hypothetical protein
MDIKQEFREEKNMDVYATNVNDGSFSNIYVKWLEAKLTFTDVGWSEVFTKYGKPFTSGRDLWDWLKDNCKVVLKT